MSLSLGFLAHTWRYVYATNGSPGNVRHYLVASGGADLSQYLTSQMRAHHDADGYIQVFSDIVKVLSCIFFSCCFL